MKKITLSLILLITSSCVSLILNSALNDMGAFDEKVKIDNLSNGNKEIAFINMHHIGRKEFFNDVSAKVDSLQEQNYLIFYESVIEDKNRDSLLKDENRRKIRKIIGFIPEQHLDTVNNNVFGKYKYSGAKNGHSIPPAAD